MSWANVTLRLIPLASDPRKPSRGTESSRGFARRFDDRRSTGGVMYGVMAPSSRNVGLVAGQQAIDTREFDRRHVAVRAAMEVHGVDCLLVPIN